MLKPKKSLGQNFLIDESVIRKIVDSGSIENRNILEIGPGTGNLTKAIIAKKPKKIFVIEKDTGLTNLLYKNLGDKITVINEDILKFDEKSLTKEKLTVFGNLPYNISTEILCRWIINLENDNFWFDELILMFQKEVADRIIAKSNTKNYGRLSILSNWKLDIKKICDIKNECFFPKPKIESSLLFFTPKKNYFRLSNPIKLEYITRIFFKHRRKMLKKPFNQIFNGDLSIQKKLKINLNLRPQNLDFEMYYKLTKEFENLIN